MGVLTCEVQPDKMLCLGFIFLTPILKFDHLKLKRNQRPFGLNHHFTGEDAERSSVTRPNPHVSMVLASPASNCILVLFHHPPSWRESLSVTSPHHRSEECNSLSAVGGQFSAGRLHLDLKTGLWIYDSFPGLLFHITPLQAVVN